MAKDDKDLTPNPTVKTVKNDKKASDIIKEIEEKFKKKDKT
jgi:hypothetical protein